MSVAAADWIVWRSCLSKAQYPTRRQAKDAVQRTAKLLGEPMRLYRCRHCGYFHAAHAQRRQSA
jgi:hypothetical protein